MQYLNNISPITWMIEDATEFKINSHANINKAFMN